MDKLFTTYRSMIPEEHYHIPFLRSVKLNKDIKRKIRSIDYESFEQHDTFPLACKELQGLDVVCELYPITWDVLKYIHTPDGNPPCLDMVKTPQASQAPAFDMSNLENMDIGSLINLVQDMTQNIDMAQLQSITEQVKDVLKDEDMANPVQLIQTIMTNPDKLAQVTAIVDPLVSKMQKKD